MHPPDEIVALYPPILAAPVTSPSRFLSVMDPLLHTGVLRSCLSCYTGGIIYFLFYRKEKEIYNRCNHNIKYFVNPPSPFSLLPSPSPLPLPYSLFSRALPSEPPSLSHLCLLLYPSTIPSHPNFGGRNGCFVG